MAQVKYRWEGHYVSSNPDLVDLLNEASERGFEVYKIIYDQAHEYYNVILRKAL